VTTHSYALAATDDAHVHLKTQRIGLITLEVDAPVSAGHLHVGPDSSAFRIELALDRLSTPNPLLEKAARALVSRGNGEALVFDATGPGGAGSWSFSGDARAGDVVVPMSVDARLRDGGTLDVTGEATFHDVHIPLPGLSHLKEISFAVSAALPIT
jgi:hypothetical protein